ncbi:MAG: cytidine deaminase [Verrucomicrobiae bacterium]|nr:cytidine deaminase [Verrucomicrobiae bacterium]
MSEIILPAVELPDSGVETPRGRVSVPGPRIAEKRLAVDPGHIFGLLLAARAAAEKAHAPYSRFHVGAALTMADDPAGTVFTGCNVENASYGATICAERNAIAAAAGAGFRKIALLAVSTCDSLSGPLPGRSPCGVCRQVIREFADARTLVLIDRDDASGILCDVVDIDRLLPWGFALEP